MLELMILIFCAVVLISGTDPEKVKKMYNREDDSDKME